MIHTVFVFVVVAIAFFRQYPQAKFLPVLLQMDYFVSVNLYGNVIVSLYYLHFAMCQSVTYTLTYNRAPCLKFLFVERNTVRSRKIQTEQIQNKN